MNLHFQPMDEASARESLTWRYEPPTHRYPAEITVQMPST